MILRMLAPVTVDFYVVPGAADRAPRDYEAFWRAARGDHEDCPGCDDRGPCVGHPVLAPVLAAAARPGDGEPPELVVDHASTRSRYNRYRTLAQDSLERPLSVLRLRLGPEHRALDRRALPDDESWLLDRITQVEWALHDHGIALLEVVADLGVDWAARFGGSTAPDTERLQLAAVSLAARLARDGHDRYIGPTVSALRNAHHAEDVVLPSLDRGVEHEGQVLWVARALVVHPDESGVVGVVERWTLDVPVPDGEPSAVDLVRHGEPGHFTHWLNYVYVAGAGVGARPEGSHDDRWVALRHAQFLYAALDHVDSRLGALLAQALATDSVRDLAALRSRLERTSRRAQLIRIQRHDVGKYLNRAVRAEMDRILAIWSFEDAVDRPVDMKVSACEERLAELAAKRAARSSIYTDTILQVIAITAVVGTAVGLVEFGRSMASDPALSRYDVGRGGITGWFAAQPTDAVIVISLAASIVLVVLYLYLQHLRNR